METRAIKSELTKFVKKTMGSKNPRFTQALQITKNVAKQNIRSEMEKYFIGNVSMQER